GIGAGALGRFACAGFTGREAWFGRAIAQAIGLPYWQPNLRDYLGRLQLKGGTDPGDVPSLSLMGTLHLGAIHPRRSAEWHPAWGFVSRTAAATRNHQPITLAAAAAPPSKPPALALAVTAARSAVSADPPPAVVPAAPAESSVPRRDPAPATSSPASSLQS